MALHTIELFAGVGMLGEGMRSGLDYMGIEYRPICFVEREAYAAAVLVARMEEGSLSSAPVWSDVVTFDAAAWRGKVDCIVAGFPCQDLSIAGKRVGLDGSRSGLFFEVIRVATDSGAQFIFLENVAAISSATAAVVDAEEGELDERAASRVVGELADSGWDSEWIVVSASDVGASHGRARWFCLAWRKLDDSARHEWGGQKWESRSRWGVCQASEELGDSEHAGRHSAKDGQSHRTRDDRNPSGKIANGESSRPGDTQLGYAERLRWTQTGRRYEIDAGCKSQSGCVELADTGCGDASRVEHITRIGGGATEHLSCSETMADASSERWQGNELRSACDDERNGTNAHGSATELCGLFAPGPNDARWGAILERFPELAPALEPNFRELVDGMAFDMGDSRAPRLRCIGNGVVPLQASVAFTVLARRSGMFE